MPSPDSKSDDALHAELRAVPLPENLLARLRKIAVLDDAGLHAAIGGAAVSQRSSERPCQTPPSFTELLALLAQLDKAKPYRGARY